MPKQAIRIPMRKSGRRLHWTFEVSADVEPEGEVSVETTTRRRSRKKRETDELDAPEPVPERLPAPALTAPDPIPPAEAPMPPAEASPAPQAAAPSAVASSAAASSGSAVATASKQPEAVSSLPAPAVRAHNARPQTPPQVSPPSAPNGRGPVPPGPSRRAVYSEMIAMTAVAALVVVVVAVPHRTSVPTGPDLQAPRVQTADVTRSPESRAPSPVAAAPVAPPAAPGVAAVTRNPAPLAAPVADTGKTAPKVAADDPAPVRPPKADPPTWAELTRRRNATTEPAESANVAASIESVALAIGGDSPDAEPAPAAPAAAAAGPLVTVTGCLEMTTDQEEFRLTETEGADAPRSRSWRSGFLRKKSAPVALVDGPGAAALKGDVGKRVAATGVLSGRDLALQSLRVVAASCE